MDYKGSSAAKNLSNLFDNKPQTSTQVITLFTLENLIWIFIIKNSILNENIYIWAAAV